MHVIFMRDICMRVIFMHDICMPVIAYVIFACMIFACVILHECYNHKLLWLLLVPSLIHMLFPLLLHA